MKLTILAAALIAAAAFSQDAHHQGVDQRGDHVMGFSHEKTTHHFRLYRDGGAIEVTANDASDQESRDQIRTHLGHIARMFAVGDFKAPMLIHDRVPPGVSVLKENKAEVTYRFEAIDLGGAVRITTKDAEALKAVHEFLRFQIADHRTGDSTQVQ
jgi:hypothetical protein